MRVIKVCSFQTANKVKFSELPAIVHKFLEEEGLKNGSFLYYLMDYDKEASYLEVKRNFDAMTQEQKDLILQYNPNYLEQFKPPKLSSIERAVKDCPKLGCVNKLTFEKEENKGGEYWVSNIIEGNDCTERDMEPYFRRIERTYGVLEADLFYMDVDFFGRVIPWERNMDRIEARSKATGLRYDEAYILPEQVIGSGIRVHRYNAGMPSWNHMDLCIDISHGGEIFDSDRYRDAMQKLLPGIKCKESIITFNSAAEERDHALLNEKAEPVIRECRDMLKAELDTEMKNNFSMPQFNIAPKLKMLAKQYGYSYDYPDSYSYSLEKRTRNGHYYLIRGATDPYHCRVTLTLMFCGLGFRQDLVETYGGPNDQSELDDWLERSFSVFGAFERSRTEQLDALYPRTPDWYKPNLW